jgi:hypothetical protein
MRHLRRRLLNLLGLVAPKPTPFVFRIAAESPAFASLRRQVDQYDDGSFVVAGTCISAAYAAALTAKGMSSSFAEASQTTFAEASKGVKLPIDGSGPVATVARTALPIYIPDARNSTLRRRSLAEQYNIRSICFVPTEGGVLEFGSIDDDSFVDWGSEMPQFPDMPKKEIRRAFAAGASYLLFW